MTLGVQVPVMALAKRHGQNLLRRALGIEFATHSPYLLAVFALLMCLFSTGLFILSRHNAFASTALSLTLRILATVTITYALLSYFFPRSHTPRELPLSELRLRIWWLFFSIVIVGALVVLAYAPTLPAGELLRHLNDPSYKSSYKDIEIRLSSSFMPMWAQSIFEFARRFAAPYCILEFFFTPLIKHNRKAVGTALWVVLIFFVFSTIDRAIPVLYLSMCCFGLFLMHGLQPQRNTYLFLSLNILGIFASITLLKNIQYGEIRDIQFSQNQEISRALSEKTDGKPVVPSQRQVVTNSTASAGASPGRSAVYPAPGGTVEPPVPSDQRGLSDYVHYFGISVIDRIVLSPVAMVLYAVERYDSNNFKHWTTTRLFSLMGFGRYVSPFEVGAERHNDAFPVTFIGDIWRNGGMSYALHYGIFLALVLFIIDRTVFSVSTQSGLSLKVISAFGLIFLFYGNAFNATSWVMLLGAAASYWVLSLSPAALSPDMPPEKRPSLG